MLARMHIEIVAGIYRTLSASLFFFLPFFPFLFFASLLASPALGSLSLGMCVFNERTNRRCVSSPHYLHLYSDKAIP